MTETSLDIQQICKILPHRYPFLLVDKIIEFDLEKKTILGQKNVSVNEPFFNGHFPNAPIMPGVLVIEALAQTGGILANRLGKSGEKIAVLLKVDNTKFRHPVKPGDVLHLFCEMKHLTPRAGRAEGIAKVGDKIVTSTEISFAFIDRDEV